MGRKNKYELLVKPRLEEIKKWIREGYTEKQIATAKLGIAYPTFNVYKQQHPELVDVLAQAKCDLVDNIEKSLYQRAMGFSYEEKKEKKIENPDGSIITSTEVLTKYALPDVGAQIFALKNLSNGKWTNSPAELELKKKEFKLKEKVADMNNF
jgi:hypothetical protein